MTENNNEKTYTIYSIANLPRESINDSTGLYQIPHLQMPLFTDQGEINTLIPDEFVNTIINGDCEQVLKAIPDNSIDLIFTSPPYADQRSATYGGIKPDQYVAWFMPKAKEFYRILKPEGSFVLNIKERVVDGERHTYVIELILAMHKMGWRWTEEYMWHKKTAILANGPTAFAIIGNDCCISPKRNILRCIRKK